MTLEEQSRASGQDEPLLKWVEIKGLFDKKQIEKEKGQTKEREEKERRSKVLRGLFQELNSNIRKIYKEEKLFGAFLERLIHPERMMEDFVVIKEFEIKAIKESKSSSFPLSLYLQLDETDNPYFFLSNFNFDNPEFARSYKIRALFLDPAYILNITILDDEFDSICDFIKSLCDLEGLLRFMMSRYEHIFRSCVKES